MGRHQLSRAMVAIVAMWIAGHAPMVASPSDRDLMPQELVGKWIGDGVSIVLSEEGTGHLNYNPPGPYPMCQAHRDGVFAIKRWSLSGTKVKLKIKQVAEARYDDGRAYRLHVKGSFQSPWLTLVLGDANHTREVRLTHEDRRKDLLDRLAAPVPRVRPRVP